MSDVPAPPPADSSRRGDIQLSDFSLDGGEGPAAVDALYLKVIAKADDAIRWYLVAKRSKKRWAITLRFLAILLGSLATVIPIIVSMIPGDRARPFLPLATLVAAVAAGCIALDRFFGFSSAWIRYISTAQDLQAKTELFQLAWARLRAKGPAHLGDEAIELLTTFVKSVTDALLAETQAWVVEFRGSLAETERSVDSQRAAVAALTAPAPRGALKVTLDGVARLDHQRWSLQVGKGDWVEYASTSVAAVTGLEPGLLAVRLRAARGEQVVQGEEVATIEPGKVTVVNLTVP